MKWDTSLECGVRQVDDEHKALFKMVDNLMNSKEGEQEVGKALDFLGEYVVNHFAHEEELMKECGYPKAAEHKDLHDSFVKTFLALKSKFEKNGCNPKIALEIKHTAMGWLINHIKVIDQRLTDYYKKEYMI